MAHTLIDAAAKVCGSRYKVAKHLGISQSYLSEVYNGHQAVSPKLAAKLAHVAGLDARDAAAVAMIENEKDPAEKEALKRVFFRSGAVAMWLFFIIATSLAPSPASAETASQRPGIDRWSVYYVNLWKLIRRGFGLRWKRGFRAGVRTA